MYASRGDQTGLEEWLRTHPHPDGIDRERYTHGLGSALFRACLKIWRYTNSDEKIRLTAVKTLLACGADPNQLSPPGWGCNVIVNNVARFGDDDVFWMLVEAGARIIGQVFPLRSSLGGLPVGSALFNVNPFTKSCDLKIRKLVRTYGIAYFAEDFEWCCCSESRYKFECILDAVAEDEKKTMRIFVALRELTELSKLSNISRSSVSSIIDATPGLLHIEFAGKTLLHFIIQGGSVPRNHGLTDYKNPEIVSCMLESVGKHDSNILTSILASCCLDDNKPPNETLQCVFRAGGRFDFDDDRFAWALQAWTDFIFADWSVVERVASALPGMLPADVSEFIAMESLGLKRGLRPPTSQLKPQPVNLSTYSQANRFWDTL